MKTSRNQANPASQSEDDCAEPKPTQPQADTASELTDKQLDAVSGGVNVGSYLAEPDGVRSGNHLK
jgi:bacteriocin-like protein